jgi:hypothetical protein
MLTVEQRPPTPEEAALLRRAEEAAAPDARDHLSDAFRGALLFAGMPVLGMMLGPAITLPLLRLGVPVDPRWSVPVGFALGVAVAVAIHLREREADEAAETTLRADTRAGQVEVWTVEATDVWEILPSEDEPFAYLLDLGDGRLLYLKGDYIEEARKRTCPAGEGAPDPFPARAFRIVRGAGTGRPLHLEITGPPLEPSETMDPFAGRASPLWEWSLSDGDVRPGRLADLARETEPDGPPAEG